MAFEGRIDRTEQLIAHASELHAELRRDPHRPTYHFMPPRAWMNDINGAIFWKGRYHIFYQHNPDGAYWKWIQWGHASSTDLVHWVVHPIALTPTAGGPDRDGCFSGGAFASREGRATFIYHGQPDGTCIATSDDDMLVRWTKHLANPVIPVPSPGEPGYEEYRVFDPCAWLDGDTYCALVGNRVPGVRGDATSLFKSQDLVDWEHVGPFYRSERKWTDADEDCAVPDFFPLGDKHMLLFCSHLQGTQYYLGQLAGDGFLPTAYGRMSWPGGHLGGPRTLFDRSGRRVFFDWIRENRDEDRERASGWSGVMTLPRVLSLAEDGTLGIEPVPELSVLRMNRRVHRDLRLEADSELAVPDVRGDSLELLVKMRPEGAREFGVKVRCSPDGAEQTAILYDVASRQLRVDTSGSTQDEGTRYHYYRNSSVGRKALERLPEGKRTVESQDAPFELAEGETLELRIFLDRSVLEVFANGRQCITQRVYPAGQDSLGVVLEARGGSVGVSSFEAWDMAPTHD